MKIRLLPVALLICAFLIGGHTKVFSDNPLEPEQESKPFYFGPVLGYNKSMHSVNLISFPEDQSGLCVPMVDGDGNGFFAGLSFEYLFGDVKNSQSSLIARVLYNSLPAKLDAPQDTYKILVMNPDSTYTAIPTTTKNSADVKYNVLTFEVQYKLNPIAGSGLGIIVGPTFDFAISKTKEQKYLCVDPPEAYFLVEKDGWTLDADRRAYTKNGNEIDGAKGFRLGLKIGVQYELTTGQNFTVIPNLNYNLGVTKLDNTNWRVNMLQIGVDLRWAIKLF